MLLDTLLYLQTYKYLSVWTDIITVPLNTFPLPWEIPMPTALAALPLDVLPLSSSTDYGPCPLHQVQDASTALHHPNVGMLIFMIPYSVPLCTWDLCWGLTCLVRGVRQTQAWEKHTNPSPSLHAFSYTCIIEGLTALRQIWESSDRL